MEFAKRTLRLCSSDMDIERAGMILRGGGLVAMPTETVYGLAAVAGDAGAVERIFVAKERPHWDPLIVHVADEEMLNDTVAEVSGPARSLMRAFWPGALTLLLPRRAGLPDAVTAGRDLVGVRMPSHPVALELIRAAGSALAAPSANRFGHVSPTTAEHVLADLDGRIDAVVDAGPCGIGVESTVIEVGGHGITLYRAGGVSASAIEEVARLPVRAYLPPGGVSSAPEALPSPGVGIRHYATRATLVLVETEGELLRLTEDLRMKNAAVLLPTAWHLESHMGPVMRCAEFGDAKQLAASLYAYLRKLDALGTETILMPLPKGEDGLFAAIRDRLQKAALSR